MGVGQFEDEPGLADARLADDGHQLATPLSALLKSAAELLDLGIPPDEA
jgi:hypothetical protein